MSVPLVLIGSIAVWVAAIGALGLARWSQASVAVVFGVTLVVFELWALLGNPSAVGAVLWTRLLADIVILVAVLQAAAVKQPGLDPIDPPAIGG